MIRKFTEVIYEILNESAKPETFNTMTKVTFSARCPTYIIELISQGYSYT